MGHEREPVRDTVPAGAPEVTDPSPLAVTARPSSSSTFSRTTVLPKVAARADKPRYQPIDRLGAGGMGEVVLVEDLDIERKVAIKRIRPEQRSEDAVARFADEVRIIGQLEHPNITPVHDVGVDEEGGHYFVMKYVEGETLEAILEKLRAGDPKATGRFSHDVRVELFLSVLSAVAYAHSRGILHRDLKPANIMVGPFGEVTVMDWGIAKRVGASEPEPPPAARAQTQEGAILGTPLYMSPEQAAGNLSTLDVRSDIFSLSLLLYEMLTLEHPLAQLKTTQLVLAKLIGEGIGIRNFKRALLDAGAPAEYGDLLERGLAHDRERRFSSVKELSDAIHAVRSGHIPVSCHITFGLRVSSEMMRFINRHPLLYSVGLFGGLVGLGWMGLRAALHFLH